jgi:UDP-N-acetylglucosamine 2-epimerase (hydrolysing)
MNKRKILFLTGTRADFGKMKSLMTAVDGNDQFECMVMVTGMHMLQQYGYTAKEVVKCGFTHIHTLMNQHLGDPMEMILATTIKGLSRYVHEVRPDMIVIHGDRVEALAGAIVGALTNTLVCHIEGGERSGTIDESIRHSVSKLSHLHMVSNDEAKRRLLQMGEPLNLIYNIGSPDIDVMMSKNLPSLQSVKEHYEITFSEYSVVMFHPVTTDIDNMQSHVKKLVDALIKSQKQYVVIFPNNDEGSQLILDEYKRLEGNDNFRVYPSISFESFLVLLKYSQFMVGNSSAGIRETPFYGIPSINVGDRQNSRYLSRSIINADYCEHDIARCIEQALSTITREGDSYFGTGNSTQEFMRILTSGDIFSADKQKLFNDVAVAL